MRDEKNRGGREDGALACLLLFVFAVKFNSSTIESELGNTDDPFPSLSSSSSVCVSVFTMLV